VVLVGVLFLLLTLFGPVVPFRLEEALNVLDGFVPRVSTLSRRQALMRSLRLATTMAVNCGVPIPAAMAVMVPWLVVLRGDGELVRAAC
jgi:hypothetical protein